MREEYISTDLCVVGGGLAGVCAAIAAARHGANVVLMQDRPVLGGNASSEIRVWVRGAAGKQNREGGILRELELENIYRNPTMNYSLWDSVLYEKVTAEPRITLFLNTSCIDACTDKENGRITAVRGWQLTTYTMITVEAKLFADCSGDSILAEPSGALFRVGREGREEYGEPQAGETGDEKTMGMSCLLQGRQTGQAENFIPPSFAHLYPDDDSFSAAPPPGSKSKGKQHVMKTDPNYWWIELGGDRDSLYDTERLRDELQRTAYGIWDHVKNHGEHGAEQFELEWLGALPGKRESRRYIGDYVLTANDLTEERHFADAVAYGGWTMDNHDPRGFAAPGYTSTHYAVRSPYPIPYRCLYSKNVDNLFFAGRNISATHLALSSTRVMATCAILGQAVGTAAALCTARGVMPRAVAKSEEMIDWLQQTLLEDECFIPGVVRRRSSMSFAELVQPVGVDDLLQNGVERPDEDGEKVYKDDNLLCLSQGSELVYHLNAPAKGLRLRMVFDPDYSRMSISPYKKYQQFAMRAQVYAGREPLKLPARLPKRFVITDGEGTVLASVADNRRSLFCMALPDGLTALIVRLEESWGGEKVGLYACDIASRRDSLDGTV